MLPARGNFQMKLHGQHRPKGKNNIDLSRSRVSKKTKMMAKTLGTQSILKYNSGIRRRGGVQQSLITVPLQNQKTGHT